MVALHTLYGVFVLASLSQSLRRDVKKTASLSQRCEKDNISFAEQRAKFMIGKPLTQFPHMVKLAAHGNNFSDWEAAVLRNSQSFIEVENEQVDRKHKLWPTGWSGKLESIARFIGNGNYGKVHLAIVKCDGSRVAIKCLSTPEEAEDEAALMRVFGKDRNDPQFVSFFEKQGHCIMMEVLVGGTFQRFMNPPTDGWSDPDKKAMVQLFYDTLVGISIMHENNVVHRDLKPENLFISKLCHAISERPRCVAKVGDLGGSCKEVGAGPDSRVPTCSGIHGTPAYMAPEILESLIKNRELVSDTKNDIWALGLILYQITFDGYFPDQLMHGEGQRDFFEAVMQLDITSDDDYKSLSEDSVEKRLIRYMLTVDPAKRLSAQKALMILREKFGEDGWVNFADVGDVATLPACWNDGGAVNASANVSQEILAFEEKLGTEEVGFYSVVKLSGVFRVEQFDRLFIPYRINQATGEVMRKKEITGKVTEEVLKPGDKIISVGYEQQIGPVIEISWGKISGVEVEKEVRRRELRQHFQTSDIIIKYKKQSGAPSVSVATHLLD